MQIREHMSHTHCRNHPEKSAACICRACREGHCEECMGPFGLCTSCFYKYAAVVVILLVIAASVLWSLTGFIFW